MKFLYKGKERTLKRIFFHFDDILSMYSNVITNYKCGSIIIVPYLVANIPNSSSFNYIYNSESCLTDRCHYTSTECSSTVHFVAPYSHLQHHLDSDPAKQPLLHNYSSQLMSAPEFRSKLQQCVKPGDPRTR